jgi:hypothetical protein
MRFSLKRCANVSRMSSISGPMDSRLAPPRHLAAKDLAGDVSHKKTASRLPTPTARVPPSGEKATDISEDA